MIPEKERTFTATPSRRPRRAGQPTCCRQGSYRSYAEADRVRAQLALRASIEGQK